MAALARPARGHDLRARTLRHAARRPLRLPAALRGGETLDGGVRAHPIRQPRRAEVPFELPSHRALAFGDTVLETDGELRVWPRHRDVERRRTWYEQRFLPTLDALTALDVERVLVTHGEPVLHDGARALAASLARPPWSRSSLY